MPNYTSRNLFFLLNWLGFSLEMDKLVFHCQNYILYSFPRKCEPWKCFPYKLASFKLALSSFRVTLYQNALLKKFSGFFQGRDLQSSQVTKEKHNLFKLGPLTHMALREAIDSSHSLTPTGNEVLLLETRYLSSATAAAN